MKNRLDWDGFREHLLNADFMVAEMDARAVKGYEFARSIAPDAPEIGEGYVASFVIFSGKHGGPKRNRAYAELWNVSDHAVYVEYGNGAGYQGDHVLTRAMDAMQQ